VLSRAQQRLFRYFCFLEELEKAQSRRHLRSTIKKYFGELGANGAGASSYS